MFQTLFLLEEISFHLKNKKLKIFLNLEEKTQTKTIIYEFWGGRQITDHITMGMLWITWTNPGLVTCDRALNFSIKLILYTMDLQIILEMDWKTLLQ